MRQIIQLAKKHVLLTVFTLMFVVLAFVSPKNACESFYAIEWRSISALAGLSIITTGMQKSLIFHRIAGVWTKKVKTERALAFFLIILSGLISTILTNDVALFITVPFTLSLGSFIKNDLSKLIIFEAMSVNVFSTLTPVGNPQNMFLWHMMNVSFIQFMGIAFPAFFIMVVILGVFSVICFPDREIVLKESETLDLNVKRGLFWFSSISLVLYIAMLQFKLNYAAFIIFLVLYTVFFSEVVKNAYWTLPLIFIVISLDFHTLASLEPVRELLSSLILDSARRVFAVSSLSSQLISNVPATVLVLNFTQRFRDILYGVNVGGNGTVIASLANIIAIDLSKDKTLWWKFHKYSIPLFLFTFAVVYMLI